MQAQPQNIVSSQFISRQNFEVGLWVTLRSEQSPPRHHEIMLLNLMMSAQQLPAFQGKV